FLGVLLDQELRWKPQVNNTIVKGTAYVFQLWRLGTTTKGIPLQLMHQLYQAVVVPKMLYATDLVQSDSKDDSEPEPGALSAVACKLSTVQHIAALAMTGAMRSTATDIVEAHTNLLPIPL
ncbi:uncharacterized protein BJ212DRAFT_1237881, partial [Suillus subaureus]